MRKIDVILLSALMLYDYSAQSLVDSDIISIGSSLITESSSFRENELRLSDSPASENGYDYAVAENATEAGGSYNMQDATRVKQIRYHDLAKINPATATVSQSQENELSVIHISVPDAFEEEMAMIPEEISETSAENAEAFSVAVVSASLELKSDLEHFEVKGEFDEGNLQFADSDNDGMFNFEDKCPGVAGVARFEGCPVPDSDEDGINDEEDRCPLVKGSDVNGGCPIEDGIESNSTTDHAGTITLNDADYSSVAQFEVKNSNVLSNSDFNIILRLADQVINNAGAGIDIYQPDNDSAAAQAATVVSYLRDLGVKDIQMTVSAKNSGGNANSISSGVEIRIRH